MKKILEIDLGTNSIGWALIDLDFGAKEGKIVGLGSWILPMEGYVAASAEYFARKYDSLH